MKARMLGRLVRLIHLRAERRAAAAYRLATGMDDPERAAKLRATHFRAATVKDLAAEASTAPSLGHPEVSSTAETSDVASLFALRPPVDAIAPLTYRQVNALRADGWRADGCTEWAVRFGDGEIETELSPENAAARIAEIRQMIADEDDLDPADYEPMTVVSRDVAWARRETEWVES